MRRQQSSQAFPECLQRARSRRKACGVFLFSVSISSLKSPEPSESINSEDSPSPEDSIEPTITPEVTDTPNPTATPTKKATAKPADDDDEEIDDYDYSFSWPPARLTAIPSATSSPSPTPNITPTSSPAPTATAVVTDQSTATPTPAYADHHYVASKVSDEYSTKSNTIKLTSDERADELARIMGSSSEDTEAIAHANRLLYEADQYKNNVSNKS